MNRTPASSTESLMNALVRSGTPGSIPYLFRNTLTVLNYHRIDDPFREGFDTLRVNVSATPSDFAKQMDYVRRHYNVITCEHLARCLRGEAKLPPRAAIITFDDGYYDNLSNAYPILREHALPAVIFLATDFMGSDTPFHWDFAAYCFSRSTKDEANLPVTGARSWSSEEARERVLLEWVEALKRIPEEEKKRAASQIDGALGVSVPDKAFSGLHLTWDQVREMSGNGIEFGAHTASHPIMTRIPIEQARDEVIRSKTRIEEEIGRRVISFAYPNGGEADFSQDVMHVVRESGIEVAFSLLSGPTFYRTVKKRPLAIRRIFLGHHDTYSRFVLKVSGLTRILDAIRQ
jgi:peptidoglycan/xylan/chitin deacetylase (PgdA/CDA1 family)